MKRQITILATVVSCFATIAFFGGQKLVGYAYAEEPPQCGSGQTCESSSCWKETTSGCPSGKVRDQEWNSKCKLNGNWTGVCCGQITYTAPASTCHYPE